MFKSDISSLKNTLIQIDDPFRKKVFLSELKALYLEIQLKGEIVEDLPAMNTDTGEWMTLQSYRIMQPREKEELQGLLQWIDAQAQLVDDLIKARVQEESLLQAKDKHKKIPAIKHKPVEIPDSLMEKFKKECENLRLPKGKTIPAKILYEIASAIGIKKVPKDIYEFKDGNPAYHEARQYASLTNYKQRRRT